MTPFKMSAAHEWLAHDPYGHSKPADVSPNHRVIVDEEGAIWLTAARNGYVSFRLLVSGRGSFRLEADMGAPLEIDLYRVWYHRMKADDAEHASYWPDALVPTQPGEQHSIPNADNRIPEQTTQAFWVDVFVPADTTPGEVYGKIILTSADQHTEVQLHVRVTKDVVPPRPCITMDHNSYGARWLWKIYPRSFADAQNDQEAWLVAVRLLHNYYRVVHEHRGLLHNLGYGHSGDADPIYAPGITGRGRDKTLTDWELYDELMGPLLDGSVFATAAPGMPPVRQPVAPIETVYAPITPNWPASYLWWGEHGYEVEFDRCVSQFDAHFQEMGWTTSRVEFFLNHKKRYRWFGWDGDEVKDIKDMSYHHELVRMWEQAIKDSPVPWIYRMDASWQMAHQFEMMADHKRHNHWVTGGFHRWYRENLQEVAKRGDTTWWYGGTPGIDDASSSILTYAYQTWARGLDGFCAWLTTQPDDDPWFDCIGNKTALLYPGERFGIDGPVPSIRLKVQRNGIQDIDLLNQATTDAVTKDQVRDRLAQSISIPLWSKPPRAARELEPEDWSSRNLTEEHEPEHATADQIDPCWWQPIRDLAAEQGDAE